MHPRVQRITPFLWFDNQAEEAARFYTAIFPDSGIMTVTRYSMEAAEAAGRPEGSAMTVVFRLDGQEFIALNGGPVFRFTDLVRRQLRVAGRGGPLLGAALRGGRRGGAAVRLAEGPVRRVVAGGPDGAGGAPERPRCGEGAAGHTGAPADEEDRHRRPGTGGFFPP